jgi:tetratricopeptide (TPR) repeat protein
MFSVRLVELYVESGEVLQAARALEEAAARWSHPTLYSMAAERYRAAGELDAAIQAAQAGLANSTADWSGRTELETQLVDVLFRVGRTDAATDYARSLLAKDPTNDDYRWALVQCLVARGELEKAWLGLQHKGEPIAPRNAADARYWVALNAKFTKDSQLIAKSLEQLRRWPDDPELSGSVMMTLLMGYLRRADIEVPVAEVEASYDVAPSGWSGSSESLVAHVAGRKAYHDDDEETAHTGAGGPQTPRPIGCWPRARASPTSAGSCRCQSRPTTGGGTSSAG